VDNLPHGVISLVHTSCTKTPYCVRYTDIMSHPHPIIKNYDDLACTSVRAHALEIAEAGLEAIQTGVVLSRAVVRKGNTLTVAGVSYTLDSFEHVYVVGVGKCSVDAGVTICDILGDALTEGVMLDVREGPVLPNMRMLVGTHPYTSAQNVAHTGALLELLDRATERDLVLVLVSGGASALLCQPNTHTPVEEANVIRHLFKSGATIRDLNTVRKHLSRARGGHMAVRAHPAETVALIFSDVPGDDITIIASGPTVYDETTVRDARMLFQTHHGERSGFSETHFFETPKNRTLFARVRNELVLTNRTALEAMRTKAEALGYVALVRGTDLQGEARDVGHMLAEELHASRPGTVILYGGETTVTITGKGVGGRNQELSLGALSALHDDELVLSLASDGRDNTDFAGGIADVVTRAQAHTQHLSPEAYLANNDALSFFHTLQQGVVTGYTGSNVADLMIGIKSFAH
jgi:glycerate 2-kinase